MFNLTIAQVDATLFQGDARQVICPGESGELTILPHHAPLVTTLREGEIKVLDHEGKEQNFAIFGGILEVGGNEARIIL